VLTLEGEEGALKLTTASYWRPSGKNIHKTKQAEEDDAWGVTPDDGYEVIVEDEELTKLRLWRHRRSAPPGVRPEDDEEGEEEPFVDRQLSAAVEYLEEQLEGK
jgi:carboxyl-terminal processing protease